MCIIEPRSRTGYHQLQTLCIFPIKSKTKPQVLKEQNSLFLSIHCNIIMHQKTPRAAKEQCHFRKNGGFRAFVQLLKEKEPVPMFRLECVILSGSGSSRMRNPGFRQEEERTECDFPSQHWSCVCVHVTRRHQGE